MNKYDKNNFHDLQLLIYDALNGTISAERLASLEEILRNDPESRRYYIEYLSAHAGLRNIFSVDQASDASVPDDGFDKGLWHDLAEYEKSAPAIQIEKPAEKPVVLKLTKPEKTKYKVSKLSIYSVVISAAAILLVVLMVIVKPVRPTVAALTDSMNAEWMNVKDNPAPGDLFRQGDELALTRGIAEITFDDGAVAIVEAPVVFKIESPKSMFVTAGKMTAIVSEYATGFTVNTPSASIVDLGTEFGVSVEGDGLCSLHMFKGKANLISEANGNKRTSQVVVEYEAKSVNFTTGLIKDVTLDERGFVRRFNAENGTVWRGQNLSVANILAGGNGLDFEASYKMLSLESGQYSGVFNWQDRYGTGQYTVVTSNPYVDGVFVPDNDGQGAKVSSSGHVFADCPDTQAYFRYDIAMSVKIPLNPQSYQYNTLAPEEQMVRLAGSSNMPSRLVEPAGMNPQLNAVRSNVLLHANSGVTLDLERIRSVCPGVSITKFHSLFGMGEMAPEGGETDIWILVDGQRKFVRQNVRKGEVLDIEVELSEKDRFLTLMVTDSGPNSNNPTETLHANYDWGLFVNPRLELE